MTNVSEWSITPGSNNSAPPDGWPENMLPGKVNDCARENMAAVAKWYQDQRGGLTTAGTTTAYTLTTNAVYTTLSDIPPLVFRVHAANTGAVTLNVDGIGAKSVVKIGGTALSSGDLAITQTVCVAYNATFDRFDIIGPQISASALTAAQILALLITVDGAGSGLDADLLDGNSSAAFATAAALAADVANLVTTNSNVATNTSNIATNTSNIATNTADIATKASSATVSALAATVLLKANNLTDVSSAATSFSNIKQAATTSATGVAELATTTETRARSSSSVVVTPDGLSDFARIKTGTYTGDGSTSLAVTGVGFQPKYVKITERSIADDTVEIFETTDVIVDDNVDGMAIRHEVATGGHVLRDNMIIALGVDGFTVDDNGSDEGPNASGVVYNYLAMG